VSRFAWAGGSSTLRGHTDEVDDEDATRASRRGGIVSCGMRGKRSPRATTEGKEEGESAAVTWMIRRGQLSLTFFSLSLYLAERLAFAAWARHRHGVFSEMGFVDDPMYPLEYTLGEESDKLNAGCPDADQVSSHVCSARPSHEEEDGDERARDASIRPRLAGASSLITIWVSTAKVSFDWSSRKGEKGRKGNAITREREETD